MYVYLCICMYLCMHVCIYQNQKIKSKIFYSHQTVTLMNISFYQLRQLRTVTRSLTASATATLVHAFVVNRLDYCSSLYAGLPACRLECLDRVLRSAVRLIGGIPKFGHVSKYMLDVLH